MERPAWLKEEAGRGCTFWRRHYDVAMEAEDASASVDALLTVLERQLAEEETSPAHPSSGETD
jgi:hypothetical protein